MVPFVKAKSEINIRLYVRLLILFLGVILMLRLSSYAIYATGAFVLYAISQKRVEFSLFALMLVVSLAIMNPLFFTKEFSFYLVTRVSLLLMAGMMTIRAGFKRNAWFLSPFNWLYAYMGYIMITSLTGWAPLISELKAILFLVFILALIQSVSAAVSSGVDIRMVRAAMLVVASFYIFGSVMTIPFPNIGQSMILMQAEWWGESVDLSQSTGLFNGVTWHSQTLGPTVAMLNAFLLSDYLCGFKKRNALYLALLAAVPVLVYMTSSRTSLLAYLLSIFASVFFFMGEKRASQSKKSQVLMNVLFLTLLAAVGLVVYPGGLERAEAFLRKTRDVENIDRSVALSESMTATRMGLVEKGMANFRERPLIGNGFQVSKEMQGFDSSNTKMLFSAPIEKGVLPVMVLEEGGAIGAALFLAFVLALYVKYRKLQFTCFLSTFTVFLGLNSGEAAFFSTSGGGGILWMVCFCALLMDVHRRRTMLSMEQERLNNPGAVRPRFA